MLSVRQILVHPMYARAFPDLIRQFMVRRGLGRSEAHTEKLNPHEWWLPRHSGGEEPLIRGMRNFWYHRGAFKPGVDTLGGNGMRVHYSVTVIASFMHLWLATCRDSSAGDLKPYPLPPAAKARIESLAESSDILILGEMHGTQEVPELVAGLLGPLTKLGYRTLALEVPNNEQASLLKCLRRETERIPNFFAHPNGDGRGNAQLLALARIAASPPFQWQILCFDQSELVPETSGRPQFKRKRQGKPLRPTSQTTI